MIASKKVFPVFFLQLFFGCHIITYAQYDSIKTTDFFKVPFSRNERINISNRQEIIFIKKAFPVSINKYSNYLEGIMCFKDLHKYYSSKTNTISIENSVGMDDCARYYDPIITDEATPKYDNVNFQFTYFTLKNTIELDNLVRLANLKARQFLIIKNQFKELHINGFSGGLEIANNTFANNFILILSPGAAKKNKFDFLRIQKNIFTSKHSFIGISGSTLGECHISNNAFDTLTVSFRDDSILSPIRLDTLWNTVKETRGKRMVVVFANCFINSDVRLNDLADKSSVMFYNCEFGPSARHLMVQVDTIQFHNCNILPALRLTISPHKNNCRILLNNSDLDKTNFSYTSNLSLYFLNHMSKDDAAFAYESLLSKFKREGKYESYRAVDIEYKQFRAKTGNFWMKFENFWDHIWWNYGYSKELILFWTIGLLLFFSLLNGLAWKDIQDIYSPAFTFKAEHRFHSPKNYQLRKAAIILLYTAFIFFSLHIDLSRLSLKKLKFVFLFFCQYTIGLLCLFFIFKFILEL
jgi:hypothetical protein